jgi:hypothetical protein
VNQPGSDTPRTKIAQYEGLATAHPCPLCQEPDFIEYIILCCGSLKETIAEIKETAFFPYLPPDNCSRASSKPMSIKVRCYMFRLLQHAFITQQHLFLGMDAVVIRLAHPQRMTLDSLDSF